MTNPSESTPTPAPDFLHQLEGHAAELLNTARTLARGFIEQAAHLPDTVKGPAREDLAAAWLESTVETQAEKYDGLLPVVGAYMDLPPVDLAEKVGLRLLTRAFIKQVYTQDALTPKP